MTTARCALFVLAALAFAPAAIAQDDAQNDLRTPIERHFGYRLAGTGEWRTPAPDYDPAEENGVAEYGLSEVLDSTGNSARGEVLGLTADGRRAVYATYTLMFNPVTDTVVIEQVGWDGAYWRGEVPARAEPMTPGEEEAVDMLAFQPDGSVKIVRHHETVIDENSYRSVVLERGADGAWEAKQEWIWTRVPETDGAD